MKINPNLDDVMKKQYLQPGETTEQMIRRVSDYVAGGEREYDFSEERIKELSNEYYNTILQGHWIPSSPFLMNAGTKVPMLSACFVLGVQDNMKSIFETLYHAALVHKMGGGTGFDFSPLRAKGSTIKSTGGTSSGVLSFMDIFNVEGAVVKQGGRRRSGNLGCLRINHPEILDFINAKRDLSRLENFNLSVLANDHFMKAVLEGEHIPLVDHKGDTTKIVDSAELFQKIIYNNWLMGEPGFLFRDNINKDNKLRHLGEITATNPCGEQPLLSFEACNLASLNLDKMVVDRTVDLARLKHIVTLIVRFLDTSIDVNKFPLPQIEESVKRARKIGLGIMGVHGMLIQMGLRYDMEEGRKQASYIMRLIRDYSIEASKALAREKGVPPGWKGSGWEAGSIEIRNLCLNTIAPTGTTGMILDTSSPGCEPIFNVVYNRRTRDKDYTWVNSLFEKIGREEGWFNDNLVKDVIENEGRVSNLRQVPKEWRELFITASEINPTDHVLMQASLQEYVDGSISKTINMPPESTEEDIFNAYILAWKKGCKGITVYRDGTRDNVISSIKYTPGVDMERPKLLVGITTKIQSGCGKLWITINPYHGRVWELFASTGSDGGCTSNIQTIARLTSLSCRRGTEIEEVVDQLQSTKCARAIANKECDARSCADAIAKQIKEFLEIYESDKWDAFLTSLLEKEPKKEDSGEFPMEEHRELLKGLGGCKGGDCL